MPQATLSLFPRMKKVLKGKHFADVQEEKQKTAEALKGIKTGEFKKFQAVETMCSSIKWRVL